MILTFEVHEDTVLSAPWLALPDDDRGHDLLPEVGLPLLHGGHHHVADASRGQPVQATLDSLHRDNVEVLGPSVVRAVHCGCHRQTQRHPELVTRTTSPSYKIDRSSETQIPNCPIHYPDYPDQISPESHEW